MSKLKLLLSLALSLPLSVASAAIAQTIPVEQQRSPATFDQYPYRPACRQLSAVPGGSAGWLAWGPTIEGEHQSWKGLESSVAPEDAYQILAETGLCVPNGELVPFTEIDGAATSAVSVSGTRGQQNVAELKARLNNEGGNSEEGGAVGFVLVAGLIWGASHMIEKLEGTALAKKVLGESETFKHLPPSYNEPEIEIPDRISTEALAEISDRPQSRTAYQTLLASPFTSRAFFGGQRTGKTNLVAMLVRELIKTQDAKVYVLNLASYEDSDEDSTYFDGCGIESVRCDLLRCSEGKGVASIRKAETMVEEFIQYKGAAVLVVDEWAAISSSYTKYKDALDPLLASLADKISGFASSGMKRRKAIYTIAPEIVAGTMENFGKAVKKLPACIVAIAPGHTETWEEQELTFDESLFGQVGKNYPGIVEPPQHSTESRIAFVNGQWVPLGTKALAAVPAGNIPERETSTGLEAEAATAIASLPAKENALPEDLKIFREWLEDKVNELISFNSFKNANKLKAIARSRESFDFLCDKACIKGWLSPQSDDIYLVLC